VKATQGNKFDYKSLPDYVVFRLCDWFAGTRRPGISRDTAGAMAAWVSEKLGIEFTREQVYPAIFGEGMRRNFIRLVPPVDGALTQYFWEAFGHQGATDRPRAIQVVDPGMTARPGHLAAVAADMLVHEVKRIYALKLKELKKALEERNATSHDARSLRERVEEIVIRIGLGAGFTTAKFAKHFAAALRSSRDKRPKIVLKAISPPFSPREPSTAPYKFFDHFAGIDGVSCEALNASSYVLAAGYAAVTESPGVRDAFAGRMDLDIIVTSFGSRSCGHGDFTEFMLGHAGEDGEGLAALEAAPWVGDVHRQPYSPDGPIAFRTKYRPISVYEIDDLVTLAANPKKSVILIAGPCPNPKCGLTREDALLPLLVNEKLLVWSHLVVDAETADACLKLRQSGRNAA
jgi:hypothetical protein